MTEQKGAGCQVVTTMGCRRARESAKTREFSLADELFNCFSARRQFSQDRKSLEARERKREVVGIPVDSWIYILDFFFQYTVVTLVFSDIVYPVDQINHMFLQ